MENLKLAQEFDIMHRQPATAQMMNTRVASLATLTGVTAAYFLAASLGSLFSGAPGMPSPVRLANGLALAAVLLLGVRVWPAVWLGAFLANIVKFVTLGVGSGHAAGAAFGIATGNTFEALAAAWLV